MYSFILLSAGKGLRCKESTPKQYLPIAGKPMIIHILERIEKIDKLNEIIIVCENHYFSMLNELIRKYNLTKSVKLVEGGDTRQASVLCGLKECKNEDIIIHEAARPFVTKEDFEALINCPYENVTYSYDIPFTTLKISEDNFISGILNREEITNIQLPQKFSKKDLMYCHLQANKDKKNFTEDSSMIFYYKDKPVYCLKGKSYNIKITEYIDLLFSEIIFKEYFLKEV